MSANKKRCLLKVIVLGDAGVGKTSLLQQYVKKVFTFQYKATVGADFITKEIIADNSIVQLQLWDTAGQEKFHSMGTNFYRNSECCVLVCDLTDIKSFETIDTWRQEFLTQLCPKDPEHFPFVLLGNKCDKENERKVQDIKLKQYCESKGNMPYFETSAKDNVNVEKAFETIAKLALIRNNQEDDLYIPPKPVILNNNKNIPPIGSGKCC